MEREERARKRKRKRQGEGRKRNGQIHIRYTRVQLTNQACGSQRLRRRRERQLIHRFCSQLFLDPIVCTQSPPFSSRHDVSPNGESFGTYRCFQHRPVLSSDPDPSLLFALFVFHDFVVGGPLPSKVASLISILASRGLEKFQCVLHSVARFKKLIFYRRFSFITPILNRIIIYFDYIIFIV